MDNMSDSTPHSRGSTRSEARQAVSSPAPPRARGGRPMASIKGRPFPRVGVDPGSRTDVVSPHAYGGHPAALGGFDVSPRDGGRPGRTPGSRSFPRVCGGRPAFGPRLIVAFPRAYGDEPSARLGTGTASTVSPHTRGSTLAGDSESWTPPPPRTRGDRPVWRSNVGPTATPHARELTVDGVLPSAHQGPPPRTRGGKPSTRASGTYRPAAPGTGVGVRRS